MRGPHNIIRLIRTGATMVRTGAMDVVLDAFDAPAPLRALAYTLGWPFQWLGYRGDPNPQSLSHRESHQRTASILSVQSGVCWRVGLCPQSHLR